VIALLTQLRDALSVLFRILGFEQRQCVFDFL
jgi:hypothetical protein